MSAVSKAEASNPVPVPSILEMLERKELLGLDGVCRLLGIHYSAAMRWVRDGVEGRKLPSVRVGSRIYVRRVELDEFLSWRNQSRIDRDAARAAAKAAPIDAGKSTRSKATGAALKRLGLKR